MDPTKDSSLTADDAVIDLATDSPAPDATGGESASAANASGEPSQTPLEAISAAIEEVGQPRRVQPKQEELDQQDTRPRNADGTFKVETADEKATREEAEEAARLAAETPEEKTARLAAETPEQKTAREAKEAAAAAKAKPDSINDPIPDGLNKRTAGRMQELIDTVKAQKAIVESHTQLFDAVRAAGSPEEFSAMLNYMAASKSNDPKVLEVQYQVLQQELRGLAIRMGKPIFEVNLLRDPANKDLVDDIAAGVLSNQRAHELALQRETQKRAQGQGKQEQAASVAEADRKFGVEDLDALEQELARRDGAETYKAKRALLQSSLKQTMARISPREWREVFTDAYEGLVLPPKAAAVIPAPIVEKQQPQRPKQPAGAGAGGAAPKSALDAINLALGQ